MKCSCRELDNGFLFEVKDVSSDLVEAVEKAYFRREEDAFIKYCPAGRLEMQRVSGHFTKLAPDAFKANGGNWKQALVTFCKAANAAGIRFTVFGSVTLALHGIDVPPHDLDILVEPSDFFSIPGLFAGCEMEPFWDFEDDLLLVRYFGRLCLHATWIDVSADAKAAMHIGDTERMEIDGVPFSIQTVESCLSAYRQSGQFGKAAIVQELLHAKQTRVCPAGLNQDQILAYWYAYIYDQQETQTDDVACLLSILGDEPMHVLEVACGSGRICVPLAQAGHRVEGFDLDDAMLMRAQQKAAILPNLHCYHSDALTQDWATGFDAVIMAGNLLINIVTDGDYQTAQRCFIEKAYRSLQANGHLYLDFDCIDWPSQSSGSQSEWVCFEGTDDHGTYGKFIVTGEGGYDCKTRKTTGSKRRYEIMPKDGETFTKEISSDKYFPTLAQVCGWLHETGFTIELLYGNHQKQPFANENHRAVIWARKT